jgi:hypothetical protein
MESDLMGAFLLPIFGIPEFLRSIQGGQEDCIMERAAWNNDSP